METKTVEMPEDIFVAVKNLIDKKLTGIAFFMDAQEEKAKKFKEEKPEAYKTMAQNRKDFQKALDLFNEVY